MSVMFARCGLAGGDLMGWGRTGRGAPLIMDPQLATSQHIHNIVLPQGQVPQGSAASGQGSAAALGLQPGLAAAPALAGSQERALEQQMQAHLHGSRLGALEQVKMQGSFSLAAGRAPHIPARAGWHACSRRSMHYI